MSINRLIKISTLMVLTCLLLSHPTQAQIVGGGSGGASQPFACNTNNASCVTQADSGAVQRNLLTLDSGNNLNIGSSNNSNLVLNASAGSGVESTINGTLKVFFGSANAQFLGGMTIQDTGGVVPTCSGGSGTCVTVTGSTNNRGQIHLTGGTAVTSITLTFSASGTWAQAPFCTPVSGTAVVAGLTAPTGACASTSSCTFGVSSTTAADITYTCM